MPACGPRALPQPSEEGMDSSRGRHALAHQASSHPGMTHADPDLKESAPLGQRIISRCPSEDRAV